ncbi:MAG: Apocarotenoid-15,15'-oxygenase [Alphaproteobacteria bacterium]|nr:Apocarotenoid-15,15'-oxygenase [Alphaproteobacteria bacterium]MBM3642095.1 Apocarotenoid-15,15'-oxygenase [Alphaproteobacteria bacterium]
MKRPAPGDRPWSAGFRSLADEYDYRIEDIDGSVPASLRGTLFRNGSGRNDLAGQWFPHWFDGDGMISAIRFDETGVRYQNRYVRTDNYVDETREGHILYRGFGKMRPGGVLANIFRWPGNVSNTSVAMLGERLLTLWEGGPPFALDPKTLSTLGLEDFGGEVRAFSAHPKLDPITGELFNFGIDYGLKTTLTPYRIDSSGLTRLAPITLPYPVMNHDFALTERFLVFCIGPILVSPLKFMLGFSSFDGALSWDGGRPTLILLISRDGSSPPRFIETEPFFQFHFANGFEEDGSVVLDFARYPDYVSIGDALRNYWRSEFNADGLAEFVRLRVDLSSGAVGRRVFETGPAVEFPRVDPRVVSKPHRYAYVADNAPGRTVGLQQRITRVDLESGATVSHDFGPNGYVGEPVFAPTRADGDEDEGVVLTFVYDVADSRTAIVGLDARDLSDRPLFVARLKHHVPFALHGQFTERLF